MEPKILDTNFISLKVIDAFQSCIWTERYCGYGDFEILTSANSEYLNYFRIDRYVFLPESDKLMIIEGLELFTDPDTGNKLTVKGRSLESILDRRIIWGQKVLTGSLQDSIEILLNENIINPVITDRKISNFTFIASTDPAITNLTVDAQFMGDNLYTAIFDLCSSAGIGFKVSLSDTGDLVFELYSGIDRSYAQIVNPYVVFSPDFENLMNSTYSESKQALKTVALIAGEGEGASRLTTTAVCSDGAGTELTRREIFVDGSSISKTIDGGTLTDPEYLAQLEQKGLEDLFQRVLEKKFEGQADTTTVFVYGTDFFLGDTLQIANEYGHETTSRVIELIRSQDGSGLKIYPTFSSLS